MANVLLVDDDESILFAAQGFLEHFDHLVQLGRNGEEALQQACAGDFDCVVMDINMPEMTGVVALRRLREEGVVTPVILITGQPDNDGLAEWAADPTVEILYKPFPLSTLERQVRQMVAGDRVG